MAAEFRCVAPAHLRDLARLALDIELEDEAAVGRFCDLRSGDTAVNLLPGAGRSRADRRRRPIGVNTRGEGTDSDSRGKFEVTESGRTSASGGASSSKVEVVVVDWMVLPSGWVMVVVVVAISAAAAPRSPRPLKLRAPTGAWTGVSDGCTRL